MQFGCVKRSAYNFFVCGPKFTIFFSANVGEVVVDYLLFRFSICASVPVDSCQKSLRILDIFALPNFRGRVFPKNSAHLNTPASWHVAWKSFVTLLLLAPKL